MSTVVMHNVVSVDGYIVGRQHGLSVAVKGRDGSGLASDQTASSRSDASPPLIASSIAPQSST